MQVLIRINLRLEYGLRYPRNVLSFFCLYAKLYKGERRTVFGHGLSDEEKKNTSDNFELHLDLGSSKYVAVVLIPFLFPKQVILEPTILQNCQDKFYSLCCRDRSVDSDGNSNAYGVTACTKRS